MQLYPIAERITEAVLIFDADAKVIDANTPSTKLMASNREELIGRSLEEVLSRLRVREGRLDLSRLEHATFSALKGQTVRDELQTYYVPGSGEIPLNMLVSAEPLWADHGEITGATLVLRDVTDITRMQQRIVDAERQVILARIATGMVHDFSHVLNVILQATTVLQTPALKHARDDEHYFSLIRKSVQLGAQMLRSWREYTRGGTTEPTSIDVPLLLEKVLDVMRLLGEQRHISIQKDLRPVAPVCGNELDLKRVFTNLALNAIEAMPNGGELRVSTKEEDGRVRISISDTGKGITAEEREKLFMPYFTTKATGSGLGLAMAKEMLAAQGGDIRFTSQVGVGTCFVVDLPASAKGKL